MNLWNALFPALILGSASGGIALMAINLRKARTIEDTPTAKIRSAAQGYLSISGIARAIGNDSVIAPLTGRPCLWYHYTIERRDNDSKNTRWTTIEHGTSEKLFALDDTTGVCHVDPQRAEVTAAILQCWQGDERKPFGPPRESQLNFSFSKRYSLFSERYRLFSERYRLFSERYRYTEKRIHAQEWVYALGWFETLHAPSLAERTDVQTKSLLNAWKQDRNRDGEIDLHEWERARTAARQQAQQEVIQEPPADAINTISCSPLREHPFLIATRDPRDMASKYRRDAIIALATGFAFAGFLFWKFYAY